jgi:uncharacterized protein YyaL (SSP411 family)
MAHRLATSDSLYLRDHADDPVDWWPWGSEALEEARVRGVPLFVSIGYSACHWCHVMAERTFRDPEVASMLNAHFVPVKVDREEHPEVDARFMAALLALQGSGGWPITAVADAKGRPAWAATYLPPRSTSSQLGLAEALGTILDALARDPSALARAADELDHARLAHARLATSTLETRTTEEPALAAALVDAVVGRLDRPVGGFGTAPKFPQTHTLLAAWECARWAATNAEAADLVAHTARRYVASGLFDHLEGGFFRYATDRELREVHFEKMLIDQAWLVFLLAQLAHDLADPGLAWAVETTVRFVARSLQRTDGLVAASLDADAQGTEGGAYLLGADEVRQVLGDEAAWVIEALHLPEHGPGLPQRRDLAALVPSPPLAAALEALGRYRRHRGRARRDDKALADWNAAWAIALVRAGRALANPAWTTRGLALARRVWDTFADPSGARHVTWHAAPRGGSAADELYLSWLALEVWELTAEQAWLERAVDSALRLMELHFLPRFGLCVAGNDPGSATPDRLDGAHPSLSSLALWHLGRLETATEEPVLASWSTALAEALDDVLTAAPAAAALGALAVAARNRRRSIVVPRAGTDPLCATALRDARWTDVVIHDHAAALARRRDPRAAWICIGTQCLLPIRDAATLAATLAAPEVSPPTTLGR